jgi:hypothetical protein
LLVTRYYKNPAGQKARKKCDMFDAIFPFVFILYSKIANNLIVDYITCYTLAYSKKNQSDKKERTMKPLKIITSIAYLLSIASVSSALNTMVALMPVEGQFQVVIEEMRKQVGGDYRIDVIDMNKSPQINSIADQCKSFNAQALILMDKKAIKAALELQTYDSIFKAMPKFTLMTLMVESSVLGLLNTAGIKFEVPFYTIVTHFRNVSQKNISKVGVFYRSSFTNSIEETKSLLERERIAISAVCVDCIKKEKTSPEDAWEKMNTSLEQMIKNDKVDVFLIPADNLIVNSRTLGQFWIDKVKKTKLPMIASFNLLASSKMSVAVFAADPDFPQLGAQAGNQIIDHFENGTPMEKVGFEPTISIKSTLNARVAQEIGWKLKEDNLDGITTIIK